MADAAAPVIVLAGTGDAERAAGLLCGVGSTSVRSASSSGDLQEPCVLLGGEIQPNRILLVELSAGLLPLELAGALMDHHLSHRMRRDGAREDSVRVGSAHNRNEPY
jgi:hypothetical protein